MFRRTPTSLPSTAPPGRSGTRTGFRRPADGGGLGLRLVVPWGRPRAPLLPALGRTESLLSEAPGAPHPDGRASRRRPLRERLARRRSRAPTRPAHRRDRCPGVSSDGGPAPLPAGNSAPCRAPTAAPARRRGASPAPRRDDEPGKGGCRVFANISRHGSGLGLRLVVPWGRPRAPLPPALGKPSPCCWSRQALLTLGGSASRKRPLRRRIARCRGSSRTPPRRSAGPGRCRPARIRFSVFPRTVAPLRRRRATRLPADR